MEVRYQIFMLMPLALSIVFISNHSLSSSSQPELTELSWVESCLNDKNNYMKRDNLFKQVKSYSGSSIHDEDIITLTFDGGAIDISKSMSDIELKHLAPGEIDFLARRENQEILSFERGKLEPSCGDGCETEYQYDESLVNESLRYSPSDLKCVADSKEQDSRLLKLLDIKKIALSGHQEGTDYYLLPNYDDGRFEIHKKGDVVISYIEFIDEGYQTRIYYKYTGNTDSKMLNLLKAQFLN